MFNFNPLSPEFQANPYKYYQMLREASPVLFFAPWNSYFLSGYADCAAGLRDLRIGHELYSPSEVEQMTSVPEHAALNTMMNNWLLMRDPPNHTRLKTLMHKAFTPRAVQHLSGYVEQLTNDLLDKAEEKGTFDLIEDYAFPVPIIVIAELIGVPQEDREQFRRWSRDLALTLELTDVKEVYDQGSIAAGEFSEYLRGLCAIRRKNPQDDLLSALIAVEEQGDKLTETELISNVIGLLMAGHETTVNLIGNGTQALLQHPDQLVALRNDLSLTRNALEEMLRFDSPVQLTSRVVLEDGVLIGEQVLNRGQGITFFLGAANRDPAVFSNPDVFDITRAGADKHIGFGNGIHFCLGAPLARFEGEIALRNVVKRFPKLGFAGEPTYRKTYVLRGLSHLPVQVN